MAPELQVSFHGMDHSPAVEAAVRRCAKKMERYSDRLIACRVVLDAINRRPKQATLYGVRIELVLSGGIVMADREPGQHHAHKDIYVAIRDAFDAARRRLQDHMRRPNNRVKQHETRPIDHIVHV